MAPRKKGAKPIFKDVVVCIAGDLGRDWTDDDILRWVKQRDGTVVQQMDGSVTHLLCSMTDFKKSSKVAYAIANLKKSCHIVTSDWLEDSIHKNRKLKEKKFLLQTAYNAHRAKLAQESKAHKAAQPRKQPDNFVIKDLYHIYTDKTYFSYEVELVRVDPDHPDNKKLSERYFLYLFESNAKPHSYSFAVKFLSKAGKQPLYMRPSSCDKKFSVAFREFEEFFEKKTSIEWMARLAEAGTKGIRSFHYTPPAGGKPVGVVTGKYQKSAYRPEAVDDPQTSTSSSTADTASEMQIETAEEASSASEGQRAIDSQPTEAHIAGQNDTAALEDMLRDEVVEEIVMGLVDAAVESTLEVDIMGTSGERMQPVL